MFTKEFWKAAVERATKSAAQAAILVVGADVSGAVNVIGLDWVEVVGFAAGGFFLSCLTSVASGVKDGNPSLSKAEVVTPSA